MTQHQNEPVAVKNLQRYLRRLSYHVPSITAPPIDGIFESDTRRALREFQAWQSLPITGIADRETWDMLYAAYRASIGENTPPRTIAFFPFGEPKTVLSIGNREFVTTVLQYMLQELSSLYTPMTAVDLSGVYDEKTALAVRDFQQKNRLPDTGSTDAPTWNAIADQYNILFATESHL